MRDPAAWLEAVRAESRPVVLPFWGHGQAAGPVDQRCLSQWHPSPFVHQGRTYATSEHFMMAEKARLAGDTASEMRIIACRSPGFAQQLGYQVRGFNDAAWAEQRFAIVVQASVLKFTQHAPLRDYLLSTGEAVLAFASPEDVVWGVGMVEADARIHQPQAWSGVNLLGFALMEARDHVRRSGP
jgi:ribA/ribD-fused uncharacterized protein